ncbi:MAG TPA: PAC2 family protein [Actinomycetota bacterium]|nr:PAC2 family protein [Actinomycetota bacterium]
MTDAVRFEWRPHLDGGTLLCAFHGWNDGGDAATTAAAYLRDRWGARRFAGIDPEPFYDFQVTRPTVRLEGGVTRRIEWPENDFFHASLPEREMAVLLGIEPNVRWRSFSSTIVETAQALGARSLVTLGAFLADVPHSVPPPVAGTAADEETAARLGVVPSRYEGPTGIVGVLQDAAARAGLDSVSLWAAVPHYLPAGTNPKAALALVQKLSVYLGTTVETDTLARAAATWEAQVATMIEENAELQAYVQRLEEGVGGTDFEVPSGEALAAELERFLREQRNDGDA